MPETVNASAVIAAPSANVRDVIADFGAYPTWANGIASADVLETTDAGEPRRVRFAMEAGPMKDTYVLDYAWTPGRITFSMSEAGQTVTELDGHFELVEADGATYTTYLVTTELKLPRLLGLLKRQMLKMTADGTVKDLRKRVEAIGADSHG